MCQLDNLVAYSRHGPVTYVTNGFDANHRTSLMAAVPHTECYGTLLGLQSVTSTRQHTAYLMSHLAYKAMQPGSSLKPLAEQYIQRQRSTVKPPRCI